MNKGLSLFAVLSFLVICNISFPQSGESEFKMVTINSVEKKITPLYPDFQINNVVFTDSDRDNHLDGDEKGTINFYIRNTGTISLKELNINVIVSDSLGSVKFDNSKTVKVINIGDSTLITIPVESDDELKDGEIGLYLNVKDIYSDTARTIPFIIPTRALAETPRIIWFTPESAFDSIQVSTITLSGLVKSPLPLKDLKVYINDQVPIDNLEFKTLPTEDLNESRIERTILLNEGKNEIKIVARNEKGISISDTRTITLLNPKTEKPFIEKRLALVIGNAVYEHSYTLKNPKNDADAMASVLEGLGFDVIKYTNATKKKMREAMDKFGEQLHNYNVGLFYYAGHGMQFSGYNYLIPVDAQLTLQKEAEYECINAGQILARMEDAGSNTNIVILDACRNNPFARSWGGRSIRDGEAGLASMNAPSGTIISYATEPGKIASDGTGKNGIYTEAILKYIQEPGLQIEEFFKNVRVEVEKNSNKEQITWESTSLKGNFYFKFK